MIAAFTRLGALGVATAMCVLAGCASEGMTDRANVGSPHGETVVQPDMPVIDWGDPLGTRVDSLRRAQVT